MVKLMSILLLYVTTINCVFNHSNLHLFCIYVANFIKIHHTVSEINIFKTWHLKCELSNIVHASSLLPKSRSISEHFTLQQDNVPAHRANEAVEFVSRNTPDYIAPWVWPPNSWDLNPVDYEVCWGVLQERILYPDSRR